MVSWRDCVSVRVMSYSNEANKLVTEVVNELRRYLGRDFYIAQISREYENRSGRGCRVYIVVCRRHVATQPLYEEEAEPY